MTYFLDSDKNWQLNEPDISLSKKLATELGISELTSVFLTNRGIKNAHEASVFLNPTSKLLAEPADILGMKKAVMRIKQAIKEKELIYIHGDYDVDGVTSTALLYQALQKLKANVRYHVPCRFKDGYGLKKKTIDRIASEGASLLITVDCGIKNFAEVDYAKTKGLDVIITDHHEPGATIPAALAVIDPKIENSNTQADYLAGVGVAMKLAQLLCDDPLEELYDLVALGTVADIAPLVGENRYLTKRGLELLNSNTRLGVRELAKAAGLKGPVFNAHTIGFTLGPRINAGGRIANASVCVELLLTEDEKKAAEIAKSLDDANRKRRDLEEKMLKSVLEKIEREVDLDKEKVIFVANEDWHDGIKGIIASKIKDKFFRPAFVGTYKNGNIQASGRSIPNFSLNLALQEASDLVVESGGHEKACGVTVSSNNVGQFKDRLNTLADKWLGDQDLHPTINIEAKTVLDSFDRRFEGELQKMEPFGEGNKRPQVLVKDVYLLDQKKLGETGNHMRLSLFKDDQLVNAIAFKVEAFSSVFNHQGKADVILQPEFNLFNGRSNFRVNVVDVKLQALSFDDPNSVVEHLFANRGSLAAKEEYKNIGDAQSFYTKLVGVTFDGRQDYIKRLKANTPLRLEREPENEHDSNAVRVLSSNGGDLGFLNKKLVKKLAPLMDSGISYNCRVTDVTGNDDGGKNLGVNVVVERYDFANELEIEKSKRVVIKDRQEAAEKIRATLLGENDYHEHQKQALSSLETGQNTLAIMGTGRGKSAIFQTVGALKALCEEKISIFLYPLRSLITDQHLFLKEAFAKLGLNVVRLSGDCSLAERQSMFEAMEGGMVDIVLTTPEFLHHNCRLFGPLRDRIGFLVVDEAHHLSTSSASHRPLYKKIDSIIDVLGNPLIMAATATANTDVCAEIVQNLGISEVVIDKTVRENLHLGDKRQTTLKENYLKDLVEGGGKVLIYVNSREKAADLANTLRFLAPGRKDKIVYYHAGLNNKLRLAVQEGFAGSTFDVVVATSAFGEGVNIGDIRNLVLFHLPFSYIEYNQQSGRCGRDGETSTIHVLFGEDDARINELILESKAPSRKTLTDIWQMLTSMANDENKVFAEVSDIVAGLSMACPGTSYNNQTIASSLKIFGELGLIEVEAQDGQKVIVLDKSKKVNLSDSVIYEEGLHEKEQFSEFKNWAFNEPADVLLDLINRAIYPDESENTPSPLAGEGWGEGERLSLEHHPPLNPLPSREGR